MKSITAEASKTPIHETQNALKPMTAGVGNRTESTIFEINGHGEPEID